MKDLDSWEYSRSPIVMQYQAKMIYFTFPKPAPMWKKWIYLLFAYPLALVLEVR